MIIDGFWLFVEFECEVLVVVDLVILNRLLVFEICWLFELLLGDFVGGVIVNLCLFVEVFVVLFDFC